MGMPTAAKLEREKESLPWPGGKRETPDACKFYFDPPRQFWDLVPTPQDLIQLALAHVASQHAAVALVDEAVDKGFWDGDASARYLLYKVYLTYPFPLKILCHFKYLPL